MPAPEPFRIMYCAVTTLSLGRSAHDLRQLRDHVAQVPLGSISQHFYETLLVPSFDDPEYRNDFALWVRRQLRDPVLAERLGGIDPTECDDLEQLRQRVLDVLEDRLAETSHVPAAEPGHEFHFLRSQLVVLDTGQRAESPEALAAWIPRLTPGSVFYHFVAARRRPPLHVDDFSAWLEAWGPPWAPVRERLRSIDFQLWSLSEMRERIVACFAAAPGRAAS